MDQQKVDQQYHRLRLQVFLGIFIGYAGYYLLRNNFSIAIPGLIKEGFSKGELGLALSAVSLAYGISKFVMGIVSDKSDARIFLPLGLLLVSLVNLAFGLIPALTSNITIMFIVLFVIGWFQGMGWPPCGRVLVHWFSLNERGGKTALWNTAHNVGGGLMAPLANWGIVLVAASPLAIKSFNGAFVVPAIVGIVIALLAFILVRNSPESVGLPPIEEYRNDYPNKSHQLSEQNYSTRELLFKHVLNNKWIWVIAVANIFVYLVRYGVENWVPTYLTEVKGITLGTASASYLWYELAGIPGTLLAGWISDHVFHGRRGPASFCYMVLVSVFLVIYMSANSLAMINVALVAIGFLIYGPVMLIGLQALDLVPKKAAGTAAGLTGLFGYFFGSFSANAVIGWVVDMAGWHMGFILILAASILACLIFLATWNVRGQEKVK
ncbi:phosphoglycerate transporter protein PgtP [Limosilactobacillus sp.]|jgi:OPA family glycerol-3-phosphate transporter-like MFS transporter|uniref:phosphoglycerate transporter protein PgtP n=1 Tax=Limosilactobacillus sp. TaxID=2773925 RepID=UPI0025BDBACF|nr:phosphoglycerate transporter protein PgtP [Limosilactobacillus sp.]MCH3922914.1 phosphoglycerate transporter protein PgtP [Limosilactobacillus sp.]MCH3927597.1 phosphoglycerate transporter protein PgtP [Limosilactobacillus sp.]